MMSLDMHVKGLAEYRVVARLWREGMGAVLVVLMARVADLGDGE